VPVRNDSDSCPTSAAAADLNRRPRVDAGRFLENFRERESLAVALRRIVCVTICIMFYFILFVGIAFSGLV